MNAITKSMVATEQELLAEATDIFDTIEKHNLSIRRIPNEAISIFSDRHYKAGDEYIMRHGHRFVRRVAIPEHAGMYMVKQVNHTMADVHWNKDKDNLAPTLQESVQLYLRKLGS